MFTIQFDQKARKELRKIDIFARKKILRFLEREDFLNNPRLFGKALIGNKKGYWRYRFEDYRIICKIIDQELIVLVVAIGHRKNIYKN